MSIFFVVRCWFYSYPLFLFHWFHSILHSYSWCVYIPGVFINFFLPVDFYIMRSWEWWLRFYHSTQALTNSRFIILISLGSTTSNPATTYQTVPVLFLWTQSTTLRSRDSSRFFKPSQYGSLQAVWESQQRRNTSTHCFLINHLALFSAFFGCLAQIVISWFVLYFSFDIALTSVIRLPITSGFYFCYSEFLINFLLQASLSGPRLIFFVIDYSIISLTFQGMTLTCVFFVMIGACRGVIFLSH
jgi:hypothetical protein